MIQQNQLLGHGDESKFNLLSGTFGDSGDVVMLLGGYGRRSRRKKVGQNPYRSTAPGVYDPNDGSGWGADFRRPPGTRDRER